jgi:tetratricopeptide (TPR) repeat protein
MAHLVAGRIDPMKQLYDRLLALFPLYEDHEKLAPGYAALGDARLADDKLVEARDAFQRALRLAPKAQEAGRWRAQVAYADAELSLSRGVLDLHLYQTALSHDPSHKAAAEALDRLSGAQASRERTKKRMAAGLALGLLAAGLVLGLRSRKRAAAAVAANA